MRSERLLSRFRKLSRRERRLGLELLEARELFSATPIADSLPPAIAVAAAPFTVERLNGNNPIITQAMFAALGSSSDGENINGPSVIRVPDWIPTAQRANPQAIYYLYFAHHRGENIRMAWASNIEGPWTLFNVGTNNTASVGEGVLDMNLGADGAIDIGNRIKIRSHIASPDVFIDDANHQIVMYFHGQVAVNGKAPNPAGQKSFVATSANGLNFNLPVDGGQSGHGIRPVILGESYFRVFSHERHLYAIANGGKLYEALSARDPWTPRANFNFRTELWTKLPDKKNPFQKDLNAAGLTNVQLRHSAVRVVDDTLDVFHTRVGDGPERILHSTIDLSVGGISKWNPTFPAAEVLHPEITWEGSSDPVAPSQLGPAPEGVNQLRDPCLFEDGGNWYLFYVGRGEDAIGIARLTTSSSLVLATASADGDLLGIQSRSMTTERQCHQVVRKSPIKAGTGRD